MHRPTIALIAIVLLAIGFYTHQQSDDAISSACFRIGAVMSILWFAHPQLQNVPRWLIAISCVVLLGATRWPKLLLVAVPIAAVLWILGPRTRTGRTGRMKDEG
jgi:uncharacterized membrane protein